jgi:GntR family transcriptional regulator, galactonate operon transcriptional repressor
MAAGSDRRTRSTSGTLSGQVMDAIGRRIVSGVYAADEVLPSEHSLCAELGLSRTPLREAMKRLHAKGLIKVGPRNGTKVLPPRLWSQLDPDVLRWRFEQGASDDLIDQLYELRLVFEPEASRLAALHGDAADHAAIMAAFQRMEALIADSERVISADLAFHMAIIAATHNIFLISVSTAIGAALKVQFELGAKRRTFPKAELDMHRLIRDAIVGRDSEAAADHTRGLIEASRLSVGLAPRARPYRQSKWPAPADPA